MTGGPTACESTLQATLDSRDAIAFVHAGTDRDPAIRYCLSAADPSLTRGEQSRSIVTRAIAFDGTEWLSVPNEDSTDQPAAELADRLADRLGSGTVLTPPQIPHDAALFLERAGFSLASTDAIERSRATKTDAEIERVASAQRAAGAGLRRGAAVLADAATADDRLVADGAGLTPDGLRRTIDEGIVSAGGFPGERTTIEAAGDDAALRPGEPIVIATTPRGPDGYHGALVRTLVVDSEGGPERRAHVGVTQAFRSVQAMLTAGPESVTAVEADLEAEIRGFGFPDEPVETRVAGVGLEPVERPSSGGDEVGSGAVVRVEAGVEYEPDRWIRLADVLVKREDRVDWLDAPSRSIAPAARSE